MNRDKIIETILFVAVVVAFLIFGQSVGWRALGVAQLVFTVRVLKDKRIGVGWEPGAFQNFQPSYYLKGAVALLVGIVSLGIAITLLFFPEETVMKLNSGAGG